MVKDSLKKMKLPKDDIISEEMSPLKLKEKKKKLKKPKFEDDEANLSISKDIQAEKEATPRPQPPPQLGNLKKRLREENKFITDILDMIHFPKSTDELSDMSDEDSVDVSEDKKRDMLIKFKNEGPSRATSVGELHERLHKKMQELRGRVKPGKAKPKLSKAEKKQKAREEKRLKAKLSKTKTSSENFNNKMALAAQKVGAKPAKPVYNADGKMVFSKFDFTDDGGFKTEDVQKKPSLDPKSALAKLKKHKDKIKSLEEQGKSEKANAIQENTAWKTALDRSTGLKVKDDPTLLKKSIKKMDKIKKQSKKKWESRVENEEKRKQGKQHKRSENLTKRKTDKKDKANKKAIKKGRAVPGFR